MQALRAARRLRGLHGCAGGLHLFVLPRPFVTHSRFPHVHALHAVHAVPPQAVLDEAMEQLLFTDGTAWEAAPPPMGLRPAVLDLIHALVATQERGGWVGLAARFAARFAAWCRMAASACGLIWTTRLRFSAGPFCLGSAFQLANPASPCA